MSTRYVFIWNHCPVHPTFGIQSQPWTAFSLDPAGPRAQYWVGHGNIAVHVVATSLADAKMIYGFLYPDDDRPPDSWRREGYPDPGFGAPPPDWPDVGPAAVCPECGNTGRVMLLISYSDCSRCRPRG